MKFGFVSVLLFSFILHTLGQNGRSARPSRCYHCVHTLYHAKEGSPQDPSCIRPVGFKVNTTTCSGNKACGHWYGVTPYGKIVIRGCSVHDAKSLQCEADDVKDSIAMEDLGSLQLNLSYIEGFRSHSYVECAGNLCNSKEIRKGECDSVYEQYDGVKSACNHCCSIGSKPRRGYSVFGEYPCEERKPKQNGGNGEGRGAGFVYHGIFLLCGLLFVRVST